MTVQNASPAQRPQFMAWMAKANSDAQAGRTEEVKIVAAVQAYECMEAAISIGLTLLPSGTTMTPANAIDLARFIFEIESSLRQEPDDAEEGTNQ